MNDWKPPRKQTSLQVGRKKIGMTTVRAKKKSISSAALKVNKKTLRDP